MDFFQYASFASEFVNTLWVQFLIGGLCFAIVFVFEAVALYTIAVRAGYKNKWMAFIPFFNTYYIGVCAQKNKFYNIDAKKIGLVTAIFEAVLVSLYIVYYVGCSLVIEYEVPVTTEIYGILFESYELSGNVPENLAWAAWMYNYMYRYILRYINLIYMLFDIALLICFFQTFACRRYVLFTVTSILFPIQGILFFVLRNNVGVNYKDFIRDEQARQYAMYQQYQQYQQNFNQNPYNRNMYDQNQNNQNPYHNPRPNGTDGQQNRPEDPFGDLGGGNSDSSPFDDFDK